MLLTSPIRTILDSCFPLQKSISSAEPIVLYSRVQLRRNLADFPFSEKANASMRETILARLTTALDATGKFHFFWRKEDLSNEDQEALREQMLLEIPFKNSQSGGGLFLSEHADLSAIVLQHDHLLLQKMNFGVDFSSAFTELEALDDFLNAKLPWAFYEPFGFLSADPHEVGTGLSIGCILHLPALSYFDRLRPLISAAERVGAVLKAIQRHNAMPEAGIFLLENRPRLGDSEETIFQRMKGIVATVVECEQMARQELLRSHRLVLEDRLSRSLAIIQNARQMSALEALTLLLNLRLAADLGWLDESARRLTDEAIVRMQLVHLAWQFPEKVEEQTTRRAQFLRECFRNFHFMPKD